MLQKVAKTVCVFFYPHFILFDSAPFIYECFSLLACLQRFFPILFFGFFFALLLQWSGNAFRWIAPLTKFLSANVKNKNNSQIVNNMQLTYGHFAKQSVKAFLRSGELLFFFRFFACRRLAFIAPSLPLWAAFMAAPCFKAFSSIFPMRKQPKCQDAESYGISKRLQWQCNTHFMSVSRLGGMAKGERGGGGEDKGIWRLLTKVAIFFCSSSCSSCSSYAISAKSIFHF